MQEFFISISDIGSTQAMVIFILILSVILYLYKRRIEAGIIVGSSMLAILITTALKNILRVPRPVESLVLETDYRFPSGHATMSAVLAALLIYFTHKHVSNKFLKYLFYIFAILWCALVSYSRLYLGVHYLIDVVVGIIIGVISTVLVIKQKRLFR